MSLLERIWPRGRSIDLGSPRVIRDPFPHFESLRRNGPIQFLPRHNAWIVLGHDEVKAALEQPHTFSNSPYSDIDFALLAADPPRHGTVRQIVSRLFSAEMLRRLEDVARRKAEELVLPELEVVGQFGSPISRAVAAELIGFDHETLADIRHAADETATEPDPLSAFILRVDSLAARSRLFGTLRRDVGDLLCEAELRSLIRMLWLAGTVTTERVVTRSVLRLLQHEDLNRAVSGDRALLAPFIEEIMRLHPPEHIILRRTTEAADLGGSALPAGALIYLCVGAANRDPSRYDDPSSLKLDRGYRRHFAFGGGAHMCVGAPLSRRVIAGALGTLLDRGIQVRQSLDTIDWFATMTALAPNRLTIGVGR